MRVNVPRWIRVGVELSRAEAQRAPQRIPGARGRQLAPHQGHLRYALRTEGRGGRLRERAAQWRARLPPPAALVVDAPDREVRMPRALLLAEPAHGERVGHPRLQPAHLERAARHADPEYARPLQTPERR